MEHDILIELYEKVLEYYANQNNYKSKYDSNDYNCPVLHDEGYKARMVLKTKNEFKTKVK